MAIIVAVGVYLHAHDGRAYGPNFGASAVWMIVFVPCVVVLCSLAFGCAAVAAALSVRGVVRLVRPDASAVVRTAAMAVVTGCFAAAVVLGFFALLHHSWVVPAAYGYAAVIAAVAAMTSLTYARSVFEEAPGAHPRNRSNRRGQFFRP